MRDLADALGVSSMTVSRALRNDPTVSEKTRERVKETARSLGYVYDSSATAFRTQKSGFVAVTLPSINNANFADTYRGLTEAMAGSGMQLLLGATNYRVEKEEELVRQLLARNPEALVMTGGTHTAETRELVGALAIPVVEMWDLPPDPLGHSVGFSNFDSMAPVVEHLVRKGRKRLAFVGATNGSDQRGADRRAGVIDAARRFELPAVESLDAGAAPVTMRSGSDCIMANAERLADFDALVCVSDTVAFGALNACRRLSVSVPGDLAISGFGQFDVAAVSDPTITTVDVGARRIGREVADLLVAHFSGDASVRRIDVGAALVAGETT